MESPSSSSHPSSSLFPSLSNDELHFICELLSSADPSTPQYYADESSFFLFPHNPHAHPPPPLPLFHHPPSSPLPLLYCPSPPPSSPPLSSSDHSFPSSLLVGFAKRDWLSSLSQSSPSSCTPPSPSPPSRLVPSSASSLANSYSLISPSHSLYAPASSILSSKNLLTCKTPSSSSKLQHPELHLTPGLSHAKINRQSKEVNGKQCYHVALRISDVKAALQAMPSDDISASKARVSMLGATAYGIALRLSDVKAALKGMPLDSHDSHISNSANASLSSPTFTLNYSASANPHTSTTSGMNQLNTSAGIPTNVDEWSQRSCTIGLLTIPNAESKQREAKKNRKTHKLESVSSKVINQATMPNGVMQNTRKTHEFQELARRREIHICNDRERRQGMKDLYGTLRSLLPDGKTKAGRCAVLTGTMEYIQCLLKQLDELGKQKVEVIMSMKESKKISNTKPDGETTSHTNHNFVEASIASTIAASCGGGCTNHADTNGNGCDGEKIDDVVDGCMMMNGDERGLESQGTRAEVGVKFYGEDAFINVRTAKTRGAWSSLLEVLQQLGIYILNVTLSTSPDSNHHRIHAKVSSSCKLSSCDLQQRLLAFVSWAQEACPQGKEPPLS